MTAADAIALAIASGLSGAAATALLMLSYLLAREWSAARRRRNQCRISRRTPWGI